MLTVLEIENLTFTASVHEFINFLRDNRLLQNTRICLSCMNFKKLVSYKRSPDLCAWRCMCLSCNKYKLYSSIRENSFFSSFTSDLRLIFRIILKYIQKIPRHIIFNSSTLCKNNIKKIICKIVDLIPFTSFENDKLGGPLRIVQVDETMLNYKAKSHRGRSPRNKTDALCIVEISNGITRAFATTIPNKQSTTIIPIICSQVLNNSIIWTDEHKSYARLKDLNFIYGTVCYKYQFVNYLTCVNTQVVESLII